MCPHEVVSEQPRAHVEAAGLVGTEVDVEQRQKAAGNLDASTFDVAQRAGLDRAGVQRRQNIAQSFAKIFVIVDDEHAPRSSGRGLVASRQQAALHESDVALAMREGKG